MIIHTSLYIDGVLNIKMTSGLQFGIFAVYAKDVVFNSGLDSKYTWSPGFTVGPNFVIRW